MMKKVMVKKMIVKKMIVKKDRDEKIMVEKLMVKKIMVQVEGAGSYFVHVIPNIISFVPLHHGKKKAFCKSTFGKLLDISQKVCV